MRTGRGNGSYRPYLAGSEYKVYCDITGVPCASSDTKMTWDGFRVKSEYWYARQPQDFPPVISPITNIPEPRPLNQIFIPNPLLDLGDTRIDEAGDIRITEDGARRITEELTHYGD